MTPSVRLTGITHKFGAFTALDNVDLEVLPGSLHAIVGENGAGKTTLMRALYGSIRPIAGTIEVGGTERAWRNSADAIAHGVGMVSQHYSVIPELTCLQNLVLGAEESFVLPIEAMTERATALAKKLGFDFDWNALADSLSPAGAQKLEITKLLWRNSKVMILDEPTAMLSPADAEALYASLRQLAIAGATVIVVTHRISEVLQHCDRLTVLRGGKKVADREVANTTAGEIAELIVGRPIEVESSGRSGLGVSVLDVRGLTVRGHRKDDAVKAATFVLRSGEIVGIAGVDGNGQRELFQALMGLLPVASGSIMLEDHDVTGSLTRDRIRLGVRLIPEDRHDEGVIDDWSLTDNAALGLQRIAPLSKGGRNDIAARLSLAHQIADMFKTKHTGLHRPMRSLSGGNQQRFVAARALCLDPRLLLAFQPTRGLDIDGTAQVFHAVRGQARKGAAALVVSFDLDELLEHCDRVLVMFGGTILEPETREKSEIGRLMVGAR